MGVNIDKGRIEEIPNEPELRELFERDFHRQLDKKLGGNELLKEELERRHDEGPPIFRHDEVIEIRGAKFRVISITEDAMVLTPMRG